MSLVRIAPIMVAPPQPMPLKALATMKLSKLGASAHQARDTVKMKAQAMKSGFRPTASEKRPSSGWIVVDVRRKDVESQVAELDALKWDVMAG